MSGKPKAFIRLALVARGIDNREHCEAARFGSGLFSRREPKTGQQKLALLRIAIQQSNFEPLSAETNALAGCEVTRVVKTTHMRVASCEKPRRHRIGWQFVERGLQNAGGLVETPSPEMANAHARQMKCSPRGARVKPQRHLEMFDRKIGFTANGSDPATPHPAECVARITGKRTINHSLQKVGVLAEIQQCAGGISNGQGVVGCSFASPSRQGPASLTFDRGFTPSAQEILGMTKSERCKRWPILRIALDRLFEQNDRPRDGLARPACTFTVQGLWGGPFLREVHGLSAIEAGSVLLVAVMAYQIGMLAFGPLDRLLDTRKRIAIGGSLMIVSILGDARFCPWEADVQKPPRSVAAGDRRRGLLGQLALEKRALVATVDGKRRSAGQRERIDVAVDPPRLLGEAEPK
jgi:hypothetical protein